MKKNAILDAIKLGVLSVVLALPRPCSADSIHPNIVFILADDQGYGDCTANNPESKITTPHIDRLAAEGMRFTDAHSPSTVCTPSRYGLLTGINPAREGIVNPLLKFGKPLIKENTPTIASFLRAHGYATKMVGKWHLGWDMDMSSGKAEFDFSKPLMGGPVDCGFDYYFGLDKAPYPPPFFYIRNRKPVAEPTEEIGRRTDVTDRRLSWLPGPIAPGFVHDEVMPELLKESLKLIREHGATKKEQPFFLYLSLTAPHTPIVPSKDFVGRSNVGPYGDFIMEIDDLVGKVDAALKEVGMEKHTILIFSSDNGAFAKSVEKAEYDHYSNGPLRGGKALPYEGGHRVPFLLKWPDVVPAGTVADATVNHTDMFATLIDILRVEDGDTYLSSAIDSHSFLPVLKDPDAPFVRPAMFNTNNTCRIGEWKIVAGRKALQGDVLDKSQVELYNLDEDLSEATDVSKEHPERLEQLVKAYEDFRSQWNLRPEAVMHQEGKKQSRGKRPLPSPDDVKKKENHSGAATEAIPVPRVAQLSDERTRKVEARDSEYRRAIAELRKKMADVLTDEQRQARDAAKRKAIDDGKKGAALRAAADAAVNLSDDQKMQIEDLRNTMRNLTLEPREHLPDVFNVKTETLPALKDGKAPQTFEELWAGFDPRKEPLDVEVLKEWEQDGVVLKVMRYRVGIFKGKKAMMAAVYGYPKDATNIPGLVQIHGGGGAGTEQPVLANAKEGYATISIAWDGRIRSATYPIDNEAKQLFWDGKKDDPKYRPTTDWGDLPGFFFPRRYKDFNDPKRRLDPVDSARSDRWFLWAMGARRAITFLEQQPEVDGDRIGVYGHSMGGELTIAVAGSDSRVKAASPSCGGLTPDVPAPPLCNLAAQKRIDCPILFMVPSNDFHGRIHDLPSSVEALRSKHWRIASMPHRNHSCDPPYRASVTLWFNQFLKNEFQMPETPETKLDLDTEDGTPVFSVTPDHSREILSVEVYYTQQDDSDYTGRVVAMTKYWQHAPAKKSEGTWTAPLPLFSTGRQLWVYADIAYALDREVFTSGGGQIVSSNIFNLSSLLTMVSADQLKAAGVTASEEPRLLIEGFRGDWEKEWFARGANRRKTFKLRSPQYQAPPNSKLGIEVQSDKKGRLTLGMEMEKDSYTSAISLNGDSKWQQVVLSPSDFKNKKGEKLADWNGVDIAIWLPGGWKWQDLKMRDLTWIKDSKGEP